ncbi:MAG: hypothetical protein MR357_04905 [Anaeroplasma sp.]|nr:hypothetical protein [Anaeroplasma sp.]
MKKILYLFIIFIGTIILASCNNTNNGNIDENPKENVEYEVVTINANCLYDDTGVFNDNNTVSFPHFNEYCIDSSSTCDLIPSFFIAGDKFEYVFKRKVVTGENDLKADAMRSLILTDDSDVKYTRAIVVEIDESQIERNEDNTIKAISYFTTIFSRITIDRNYNSINISDYNGEKVYVSYSVDSYPNGKPYRLYSFNPLKS